MSLRSKRRYRFCIACPPCYLREQLLWVRSEKIQHFVAERNGGLRALCFCRFRSRGGANWQSRLPQLMIWRTALARLARAVSGGQAVGWVERQRSTAAFRRQGRWWVSLCSTHPTIVPPIESGWDQLYPPKR